MIKWDFPSNNNAGINGFNDAGIATFANTLYESLVREAIQNSLDAKCDSYDGPVEVHFDQLSIPTDNIPGRESLDDALVKCSEVESNNLKTTEFFNRAHMELNKKEIYVLKVSDYHTIGLKGSSTGERGTSWSRLVKESGTNDKAGDAGGSFGIGKSAYFACSRLRTVFFSSLSEDEEKSNIGVAKLISFDLEDGTESIGTGYYAREKNLAFPELADFDGLPVRTESGTDIYILGNFISDESIYKKLVDSVIANFMISIVKGKLIVRIGDVLIDSAFVDNYFAEKAKLDKKVLTKDMANLLEYYRIVTGADTDTIHIIQKAEDYGKEYGFRDGECELYLKKGADLNRKILMTRKTGMKLFEQGHISGSIVFSGVLYISGSNMNRMFRDMEGPAHNKWEPNQQADNYQEQEEAYLKLRDYIRKQVSEHFEDKVGDEFDAFDVGDYLPDTLTPVDGGNEGIEISLQNQKVKVSSKPMKPTRKKMKAPDPIREMEEEETSSDVVSAEKTGTGDGPGIGSMHNGGEGGGAGLGTGDGPGDGSKPGNGDRTVDGESSDGSQKKQDKTSYKENGNVSKRAICLSPEAGLYKISVRIPNKARHAKMCLTLAAEQSDYKLQVLNVGFSGYSGNAVITGFNGNSIFLENLSKDEIVSLAVAVEFNGYCMMEVDYYESKK